MAAPLNASNLQPHVSRMDDLPTATVQCHASNLLRLPDDTLLCAWFGGTQEGTPDISIYLSRRPPGSPTWEPPTRVSSDPHRSEQNPVLFRDPAAGGGALWLFHTAQEAGDQDLCEVVARVSADGTGLAWGAPFRPFADLPRGIFVRQPVVVLPDSDSGGGLATWVLPAFRCRAPPGFRWNGSDDVSVVLWSRDGGRSWAEREVPGSAGCVHMAIVPLGDGDECGGYVAFFRSRWADRVYRSTSRDGIEWAAPETTELRNPNSGIGAAALPGGGGVMLVFNDSCASADIQRREGLYDDITPAEDTRVNQPEVGGRSAIWGTPRKALSVGISRDGGLTWKCKVLEDGDGFCMTNSSTDRANRELSYPSILADSGDGNAGVDIAYTFYRQHIRYVRISDVEAFVAA